jgi:hypothetical protein
MTNLTPARVKLGDELREPRLWERLATRFTALVRLDAETAAAMRERLAWDSTLDLGLLDSDSHGA